MRARNTECVLRSKECPGIPALAALGRINDTAPRPSNAGAVSVASNDITRQHFEVQIAALGTNALSEKR